MSAAAGSTWCFPQVAGEKRKPSIFWVLGKMQRTGGPWGQGGAEILAFGEAEDLARDKMERHP